MVSNITSKQMNYKIAIKRIDTVNEVEGYWTTEDLTPFNNAIAAGEV